MEQCDCHVSATGSCALRYSCLHTALVTSNMDETVRARVMVKVEERSFSKDLSREGMVNWELSKVLPASGQKLISRSLKILKRVGNASLLSFDQDEEV